MLTMTTPTEMAERILAAWPYATLAPRGLEVTIKLNRKCGTIRLLPNGQMATKGFIPSVVSELLLDY